MNDPNLDPFGAPSPDIAGTSVHGALVLAGRAAIRDACQSLAQGARRELLIFSRDLDPDFYDQPPFLAEVQRLALATPHVPVRARLFGPKIPVTAGHRMIGLARQLTSRMAFRRVAEDFRDRPDAFLIADGRGYCFRRLADRPEALVDYDAPGEASRMRAGFEHIWERSDVDTELRRLYL
jgi:hypothetical protein